MENNGNQIFNYDDISLRILMELEKIKNGLNLNDKCETSINADKDNHGTISGTGKIELQGGKISFIPIGSQGSVIPLCPNPFEKPKIDEEEKKIMDKQIKEALEDEEDKLSPYGEKFMKEAEDFRKEVIHNYLFLVGPIYAKITSLRRDELFKIFRSEEFIKFKDSLPHNQRISIDGYIIHREEIPLFGEPIPGFDYPKSYEYKYDQIPEDITFLFGSEEYIKKIKELKNSIISFKDYIKIYYELPYESPYIKQEDDLGNIDVFEPR